MTLCCSCSTVGASTNCCPEEVAVSITNNIIQIGESTLQKTQEIFTVTGTTLQLSHSPFWTGGVLLLIDGVIQRYGTDFTVSSTGAITLTEVVTAAQVIVAYDYLTGYGGMTTVRTSSVMTLGIPNPTADDVPDGWLILDGGALLGVPGAGYLQSLYPDLYAAVGSSYGVSDDGEGNDTFLVQEMKNVFYSGDTLVALYSMIKT